MAKRILVVEDNDLNRKLFCDVLKANGYEVVPVADGQNVIATARKFKPHGVVLDIQLPNITGLELIEQFRGDASLRAIPILAVTAYAGKGDEDRIRGAGAQDYLAKPVSITPFMRAVRNLLGDEPPAA
ncbi:response regulator [Qipengyuania sp.]|uniref:response regulator n=1 Tax=Qipengyuania sp. TaxID=2004515 RepID=UPI0035C833B1